MLKTLYLKKGQAEGVTGGVVTLIAGMAVATLVLIFVGVLGGQTYELVESDLNEIGIVYNNTGGINYSASNYTIQNHVKSGIISGFKALEQTGKYLPIIVLAVVISLVLFLVLGMSNIATGGGRGTAL